MKRILLITGLLSAFLLSACSVSDIVTLKVKANYEYASGYLLLGSSAATLTISNLDSFEWHDVKITLNDVFSNFNKIPLIKAGETYQIKFNNLTKPDGTFFDIRTTTPLKLEIRSNEGSYVGTWEQ